MIYTANIYCQKCGSEDFETIEPDECNEVGEAIGSAGFLAVLYCSSCDAKNYFRYALCEIEGEDN